MGRITSRIAAALVLWTWGAGLAALPLYDSPLLKGSWASPDTLGQGFFLDTWPGGGMLFAGWFTYAPGDGAHLWLSAQLHVNGGLASGPLFLTRGGRFDAAPGPEQHVREVGTMTVDFLDCRTARVTYSLVLDGRSDAGSFMAAPLTTLVDGAVDCDEPTKLRWPHAAPGLDAEAYAALVEDLFVINNFPAHQQGSGGDDDIYFHSGLDIVLPNGTPIHALEPGTVRSVTPDSTVGATVIVQTDADPDAAWGYVHITPEVAAGQRVAAGDRVGVVRFSGVEHLHLSRLVQPDGISSWEFGALHAVNPIGYFVLPDDEAPVFRPDLLLLRDGDGTPFTGSEPVVVSGDVDIVAGVHDPGPHTRRVDPLGTLGDNHAVAWIEYEIRGQGRHVYQRAFDFLTVTMDQLGGGVGGRGPLTRVVYLPYLQVEPSYPWQGIHGYYFVTHGSGGARVALDDAQRAWHTAARDAEGARLFPDGIYEVTVRAADAAGNISEVTNRVEVDND